MPPLLKGDTSHPTSQPTCQPVKQPDQQRQIDVGASVGITNRCLVASFYCFRLSRYDCHTASLQKHCFFPICHTGSCSRHHLNASTRITRVAASRLCAVCHFLNGLGICQPLVQIAAACNACRPFRNATASGASCFFCPSASASYLGVR